MTDDELAAKCAERSDPLTQRGELLGLASERLYALSALCALRGASLAQAEREAEAVAASEPFGHFRALPMGWEDCAETDEGAIALYERPAPAASAEPVAWLTHSRNGMVRSLLMTRTPDESLMRGDVQQPLYAAPQPDRVAELEAEVERLRSQVASEQYVARAAVYARIDAENERDVARAAVAAEREACAAMVQGWDTAMTDKLAAAIRARAAKRGE